MHHAELLGERGEALHDRAVGRLGVAVVLLVLGDAEVGPVEQLLEADDLRALGGGVARELLVLVEHRLLVAGPGRLADGGLARWSTFALPAVGRRLCYLPGEHFAPFLRCQGFRRDRLDARRIAGRDRTPRGIAGAFSRADPRRASSPPATASPPSATSPPSSASPPPPSPPPGRRCAAPASSSPAAAPAPSSATPRRRGCARGSSVGRPESPPADGRPARPLARHARP